MHEIPPRWRKVWRDAMLHRARTLLVVLAIAVGVAGGGTILVAWALVDRATHEGYLASNPAAATLHVDSIDAAVLAIVRGVDDVRLAEARRTTPASILAGGSWHTALLFAVPDFEGTRVGTLRRDAGPWPVADGDLSIERSSLSVAGISLGDPVSIAVANGEPVPLRAGGIVHDVELAPGWMEHIVYAFVTPATLARLGLPSTLDEAGHLRTYSDARGDLRGPPTPIAQRGPETTIVIDFDRDIALASNRDKGTDRGLLLIVDATLKSQHLGAPLAMLDRLHRQCGAPAYGKSDEMR